MSDYFKRLLFFVGGLIGIIAITGLAMQLGFVNKDNYQMISLPLIAIFGALGAILGMYGGKKKS